MASFNAATFVTPADLIFKTQTLRPFLYKQAVDPLDACNGPELVTFVKPNLQRGQQCKKISHQAPTRSPQQEQLPLLSSAGRPAGLFLTDLELSPTTGFPVSATRFAGRSPVEQNGPKEFQDNSFPHISGQNVESEFEPVHSQSSALPFQDIKDSTSIQQQLVAEHRLQESTKASVSCQLKHQDSLQRRMRPSCSPTIRATVPMPANLNSSCGSNGSHRSAFGAKLVASRSAGHLRESPRRDCFGSSRMRFSERPDDHRVRVPAHRIGDPLTESLENSSQLPEELCPQWGLPRPDMRRRVAHSKNLSDFPSDLPKPGLAPSHRSSRRQPLRLSQSTPAFYIPPNQKFIGIADTKTNRGSVGIGRVNDSSGSQPFDIFGPSARIVTFTEAAAECKSYVL